VWMHWFMTGASLRELDQCRSEIGQKRSVDGG
jgi:hypothetical protein